MPRPKHAHLKWARHASPLQIAYKISPDLSCILKNPMYDLLDDAPFEAFKPLSLRHPMTSIP